MRSIYAYQKVTDDFTTYQIQGDAIELATLEGITYASVLGDLPTQHEQLDVQLANLTPELQAALRKCDQCKGINALTVAKIREKYSAEDEIKALRLGGAAESAWKAYIESCVAEGESAKAELGL